VLVQSLSFGAPPRKAGSCVVQSLEPRRGRASGDSDTLERRNPAPPHPPPVTPPPPRIVIVFVVVVVVIVRASPLFVRRSRLRLRNRFRPRSPTSRGGASSSSTPAATSPGVHHQPLPSICPPLRPRLAATTPPLGEPRRTVHAAHAASGPPLLSAASNPHRLLAPPCGPSAVAARH
jgi:hypothetical protein